jgi:hypothetical protein
MAKTRLQNRLPRFNSGRGLQHLTKSAESESACHAACRWAVTDLQHSKSFDQWTLIGPCLHTIRNQDLMVPFEGFEVG